MRVVAQYTVPILRKHPPKARLWNATAKSNFFKRWQHLAVDKPWKRTGASWIDDFVARRRAVILCQSCSWRYGTWWKRYQYRGDWVGWWSTCDGCRTNTRCNGYFPEELIGTVLHPRYWKR